MKTSRKLPPRSSKFDSDELRDFIRTFVEESNIERRPTSAGIIASAVKDKLGVDISKTSMRRLLRSLGMSHIRGKLRNHLADKDANVAFREKYLEKKLSNRNGNCFPMRPEVFLDESFCNLNHVANKTWVLEDKIRYQSSGKGAR